LARAVSDEGLSREILEAVGQLLKNSVLNQCFRQASYRRSSILS
jgi:hypothetical protein